MYCLHQKVLTIVSTGGREVLDRVVHAADRQQASRGPAQRVGSLSQRILHIRTSTATSGKRIILQDTQQFGHPPSFGNHTTGIAAGSEYQYRTTKQSLFGFWTLLASEIQQKCPYFRWHLKNERFRANVLGAETQIIW